MFRSAIQLYIFITSTIVYALISQPSSFLVVNVDFGILSFSITYILKTTWDLKFRFSPSYIRLRKQSIGLDIVWYIVYSYCLSGPACPGCGGSPWLACPGCGRSPWLASGSYWPIPGMSVHSPPRGSTSYWRTWNWSTWRWSRERRRCWRWRPCTSRGSACTWTGCSRTRWGSPCTRWYSACTRCACTRLGWWSGRSGWSGTGTLYTNRSTVQMLMLLKVTCTICNPILIKMPSHDSHFFYYMKTSEIILWD